MLRAPYCVLRVARKYEMAFSHLRSAAAVTSRTSLYCYSINICTHILLILPFRLSYV